MSSLKSKGRGGLKGEGLRERLRNRHRNGQLSEAVDALARSLRRGHAHLCISCPAILDTAQAMLMADPHEKLDPMSLLLYMSGISVGLLLPAAGLLEPSAFRQVCLLKGWHGSSLQWHATAVHRAAGSGRQAHVRRFSRCVFDACADAA